MKIFTDKTEQQKKKIQRITDNVFVVKRYIENNPNKEISRDLLEALEWITASKKPQEIIKYNELIRKHLNPKLLEEYGKLAREAMQWKSQPESKEKAEKEKVLVLSSWWSRWFYQIGVLRALEELGMADKINILYGVSSGAIIWAYWCAGYKAEEIYERLKNLYSFTIKDISGLWSKQLIKNDKFKRTFSADLPWTFEELNKKLSIGCVDKNTWKFMEFTSWNLLEPLLGSMAIPGVFPVVPYQWHLLIDGGTSNDFPADKAREEYPDSEIIGVVLNKFKENQKHWGMMHTLSNASTILRRSWTINNIDNVDITIQRDLDINILSTNREKMKKIYEEWYRDTLKKYEKKYNI